MLFTGVIFMKLIFANEECQTRIFPVKNACLAFLILHSSSALYHRKMQVSCKKGRKIAR